MWQWRFCERVGNQKAVGIQNGKPRARPRRLALSDAGYDRSVFQQRFNQIAIETHRANGQPVRFLFAELLETIPVTHHVGSPPSADYQDEL
jgi:hypothetical protein